MKPTLIILAAGMGSRYGSLKQIDAVGPSGEAIIDYSIYDAIRAGFGKLVFVIRKELEELLTDIESLQIILNTEILFLKLPVKKQLAKIKELLTAIHDEAQIIGYEKKLLDHIKNLIDLFEIDVILTED